MNGYLLELLDGAEDELLGTCPYFTGDAERRGAALDAIREVQSMLAPVERLIEAARLRISGSHAMGCNAYGLNGAVCDCGRDDLRDALVSYDAVIKETSEAK